MFGNAGKLFGAKSIRSNLKKQKIRTFLVRIFVVDDTRLELVTSRTSSGCATSCANRPSAWIEYTRFAALSILFPQRPKIFRAGEAQTSLRTALWLAKNRARAPGPTWDPVTGSYSTVRISFGGRLRLSSSAR